MSAITVHDTRCLERSLGSRRTLVNALLTGLTALLTAAALTPLMAVLIMLLYRGSQRLDLAALTQLPPPPMQPGGGIGNAIAGTLAMTGLAAMIAVPAGILGAIYLAEIAPESRLARTTRSAAKVLSGLPAILAGVFTYGAYVLFTGGYSAVAGGIALAILMLPTVVLAAEEALRAVPNSMKQAAAGLGATQFQYVWMVLLPAAWPGVLTGVMLAVARAAGETAPLLFTALFSNYWLAPGGQPDLMQPTASLAVLIYNFSGVPFQNQVDLAWTAALVLVLIVLAANLGAQAIARRYRH